MRPPTLGTAICFTKSTDPPADLARNTFPDTPRVMFSQIPGYRVAQSRGPVILTPQHTSMWSWVGSLPAGVQTCVSVWISPGVLACGPGAAVLRLWGPLVIGAVPARSVPVRLRWPGHPCAVVKMLGPTSRVPAPPGVLLGVSLLLGMWPQMWPWNGLESPGRLPLCSGHQCRVHRDTDKIGVPRGLAAASPAPQGGLAAHSAPIGPPRPFAGE